MKVQTEQGDQIVLHEQWRARLPHVAPLAVDVFLAAMVTAISLLALFFAPGAVPRIPPSRMDVVLTLITTAPLAARRRFPYAVLVVLEAGEVCFLAAGPPISPVLGLGLAIALYTLATGTARRISLGTTLTVALINALVLIWGIALGRTLAGPMLFAMTVLALGSWSLGENTRIRRAYLAHLEERARRLELEREENARHAVQEERTRIARELHDVVAHHVSAIVVQAGGAEAIMERDPDRARQVMRRIQETGRQSLNEMRALLNVLRGGDEIDASRSPQPSLAQIEWLISESRASGLPVSLTIEGAVRPLPEALDLSAYRIVQEALTNSLKHAGPADVQVVVRYGQDALELQISDTGRTRAGTPVLIGSGRGIIGMRERVALFGGDLSVGPAQHGGFLVRVRLPMDRP